MFGRLTAGFSKHTSQLPLEKQITLNVILMLSVISIFTGLVNTALGFPAWYQLLIFFEGFLGFSVVLTSYIKKDERFIKLIFVLNLYLIAFVSWPYNAGIDGPVMLFFFAIPIFCMGVFGRSSLLHFILNYIFFGALVLTGYKYPDLIRFRYAHENTRIADILVSYLIMGFSVISIIIKIITKYRSAMEIAEQNELKFRILFSMSPDPVFIIEKNTGKIIDINEKVLNTYKYERDELIGRPATFVSAEPEETSAKTASPENYIPLRYHRRKNGEIFPTEITAEVITISKTEMIIASIRDISERIKIEEEKRNALILLQENETKLRKSETRLKLAIESARAGVWEIDYTGRKFDFNNFCVEMMGYELSEIGRSLEEIMKYVHPDDLELFRKEISKLVNDHDRIMQCRIRALTKDKKWKWIMVFGKVSELNASDGSIRRMTGINIDINHMMNMQSQLEKMNTDKTRFFSILSHDLRGPFSSLLGLSDLLIRNIHKYDLNNIRTHVSYINDISHNTYNLLEDLLLWSGSQSGNLKFEPVSIRASELFSGIIKTMSPSIGNKRISIKYLADDRDIVFGDIDMLNTVLRNLVSNSIKFTHEGGEILISSKTHEDGMLISVSDNGIGIPEKDQAKLWNITTTYSVKGTNGETGTGMGLILCKDFIEKHGGKIWVESQPGAGSTFKMLLPSVSGS